MKGYFGHIEKDTLENDNFRKVLYTGPNSQLVLMSLKPGEDIGVEEHDGHDQFFRFESGEGEVIVGEDTFSVKDGDAVIVPSGARHNVTNKSLTEDLRLYTIYSPAEHPDGVIFKTKKEALASEEDH
jgi:mannose-6-phosphate isomerase-like protein (cupin superfamily)